MSNTKQRCIFCFEDSADNIKASSEHLFSKPVSQSFGFALDQTVARTDSDLTRLTFSKLKGLQYRCVCTNCNNGWMNRLELAMPLVAEWLTGSPYEPLGQERASVLRNWAIKTHIMFCFIEGGAGRFLEEGGSGNSVVTPASLGKHLWQRDAHELANVTVGLSLARRDEPSPTWTFGSPTVTAPRPPRGLPRFAPVTVLTIGRMRLWVVAPYFPATVRVPHGVLGCEPGLTVAKMTFVEQPRSPGIVRVAFTDSPALLDSSVTAPR